MRSGGVRRLPLGPPTLAPGPVALGGPRAKWVNVLPQCPRLGPADSGASVTRLSIYEAGTGDDSGLPETSCVPGRDRDHTQPPSSTLHGPNLSRVEMTSRVGQPSSEEGRGSLNLRSITPSSSLLRPFQRDDTPAHSRVKTQGPLQVPRGRTGGPSLPQPCVDTRRFVGSRRSLAPGPTWSSG